MSDKSKTVIVKKVKKGHEGHHGGSWKVAYADFVTAMMAFFLLMWLLAMVSPEKRTAVSEYFKHFSLFDKSGKSFMQASSQILSNQGGEGKTADQEFGKKQGETAEVFKNKLKKAIDEKMQALKDHVMVDSVPEGVRIQLVDTEGKPLFYPGSAQLSPNARELLRFVADNIKDMPNKIAVEGHTDAAPLRKEKYSNWELSTERASAARRDLQMNDIDINRVARVVGYADTELLYKDNPKDSRNRRISIIVLHDKVKEEPKPVETKPALTPESRRPSWGPAEAPQPLLAVPPSEPLKTERITPAPAPQIRANPEVTQQVVPEQPKKSVAVKQSSPKKQRAPLLEPIGVAPGKPIELNKPFEGR